MVFWTFFSDRKLEKTDSIHNSCTMQAHNTTKALFVSLAFAAFVLLVQLALLAKSEVRLDSVKLREKLKNMNLLSEQQISTLGDMLDSLDSSKPEMCGQEKYSEITEELESYVYNLDFKSKDAVDTAVYLHLIELFKGCERFVEENMKRAVEKIEAEDKDDVCKIMDYVKRDYSAKKKSVFDLFQLPDLYPNKKLLLGILAYMRDTVEPESSEMVFGNEKAFVSKYKDLVARPCASVWKTLKFGMFATVRINTARLVLNSFTKKWLHHAEECSRLVADMNRFTKALFGYKNAVLTPRKS